MEIQCCTPPSSIILSNRSKSQSHYFWDKAEKLVTGCSGQWWVYDVVLEERTLLWRIRCCNPYTKSTKRHHNRNRQGAGIQLLMQNNAVYPLFTLPWLPLALIKSLYSSRGCSLDEVTTHFPPWRASTLSCRCARIVRGIPKSSQGKRAQGWGPGAGWGHSRARGTEEYQGDPFIPLPPSHTATISKSPVWAKVGRAVPETGFAPEGEARFEYRAVNETLPIATSTVDTDREETEWGGPVGITHVG